MRRLCVGDWLMVSGDITRAGFSEETLDCVRDEIDHVEKFADVLTMLVADLTDAEYDVYAVEFESRLFDWNEALESCYTEVDEDTYKDYNAWIDGLNELPDATTNDDFVTT
jgi:hypothetical protein